MNVIEDGVGTVPMHPGIDSARISHLTILSVVKGAGTGVR